MRSTAAARSLFAVLALLCVLGAASSPAGPVRGAVAGRDVRAAGGPDGPDLPLCC
ncbi:MULTISPECIES: hypothetical protein [unclassified Streptomyces]|uniref:hypothetical protein n=1 Tax=unclassified Streptomyces TaxID=2593676 RepID=UPI0034443282